MVDISCQEVNWIVEFMYLQDYNVELSEDEQSEDCPSELLFHSKMFVNGDRYDIPALRTAAVEKYSSKCSKSWDPIEFLQSIPHVYDTTPDSLRPLRDTVIEIARAKLQLEWKDEVIASRHTEIIKNVPGYAQDLALSLIRQPSAHYCIVCRKSQSMEVLLVRCKECKEVMLISRFSRNTF